MSKKNYHVTNKKGSDEWRVVGDDAKRAAAIENSQSAAEKIAKQFSANQGGGEVRIHRPNGGPIRDSDTVAPGNESPVLDKKH
jgi:hypothetical protein